MTKRIPLRSWLLGLLGALLGCGLFCIDTFIETLGPSAERLHLWVETIEFSLVGPGLGIMCLLLAERVRTLREHVNRQQLAEREQRYLMLGRMAASVAHEVRNPLHTLRLVVDELRVQQPDLQAHPLSSHIDQSLERIDRAVDLVYQLARPGEDEQASDLVVALRDAQTALSRYRPERQISFATLPEQALVRSTPSGLRIMLENLLRNAVEATPAGMAISVDVRLIDGQWQVRISNPGDLPSDQPEADVVPESDKLGGLGLGLIITRQLASNAGGTLQLVAGDGQVTACLTLPVATP